MRLIGNEETNERYVQIYTMYIHTTTGPRRDETRRDKTSFCFRFATGYIASALRFKLTTIPRCRSSITISHSVLCRRIWLYMDANCRAAAVVSRSSRSDWWTERKSQLVDCNEFKSLKISKSRPQNLPFAKAEGSI